MNLFLAGCTSGAGFLLGFLLFFHPLQQNAKANRWLGFFVFIIACAFVSTYMMMTASGFSSSPLFKCFSSLQFLLAPSLYISILYFVRPAKRFAARDWLHFAPFVIYVVAEAAGAPGKESLSTLSLFAVNENVSFLVRDILPFLTLFYLVRSYAVLKTHKANLELITATTDRIDLDWLVQFLFILLLTVIIWINDALLELPYLTEATPFVYAGSIFFLAYFSIRQKTIFAFGEKDMKAIVRLLDPEEEGAAAKVQLVASTGDEPEAIAAPPAILKDRERPKLRRLTEEQAAILSARLTALMEQDRLFLDNDLDLPTVAEKLGIGIHEASFLINETTQSNFYTFINTYRVAEAKKLLASPKMEELNILGIAFASGFNSKTTFNTTFKRIVGISPSQYSRQQKK